MIYFSVFVVLLSVATCKGQQYWGGDNVFYGGGGGNAFHGYLGGGFDYWYGELEPTKNIYDIQLEGGYLPNEGRVVLIKNGARGTVCDYGWEKAEADAVCKHLGFLKGGKALLQSAFEPSVYEMWISYANCRHNEIDFNDCEFSGMYARDRAFCNNRHEAGVRCYPNDPPPTTSSSDQTTVPTEPPANAEIKLIDGKGAKDGQIVILGSDSSTFKGICFERFTVKEAIVACRQLSPQWYAKRIFPKEMYQVGDMTTVTCTSEEERLQDCQMVEVEDCTTLAAVECSEYAPDLHLDMKYLISSVGLRRSPIHKIQCAIEEKCLAQTALGNATSPNHMRQMVKFSALVMNNGTADFRPPGDPDNWEWHECHRHFHSIAEFAYYDVISVDGKRKVESGHKVSYCLRDSICKKGARPKYYCTQYRRNGQTQGISVNCGDLYGEELDCQWVDITDVPTGNYFLEIRLNPHKLVAETRYDNNFYQCEFHYDKEHYRITNNGCKVGMEIHNRGGSYQTTTRAGPIRPTNRPNEFRTVPPLFAHRPL